MRAWPTTCARSCCRCAPRACWRALGRRRSTRRRGRRLPESVSQPIGLAGYSRRLRRLLRLGAMHRHLSRRCLASRSRRSLSPAGSPRWAGVFAVARAVRGSDRVLTLVLTGVVIGAPVRLRRWLSLKLLADPYNQLQAITFWLLGSLVAGYVGGPREPLADGGSRSRASRAAALALDVMTLGRRRGARARRRYREAACGGDRGGDA